ncbi:t-SNARE [Rhizoclosmatium globosum]|uniref:t-SNARE n=1 Tax=Rhizoclosmatium globosum TaxID=329046 RepID=A0A1Y2CE83_9FUNG|nr:t-SNARE [Rhizoclosmatium globosum]|eukprot:ORY45236.1 t-SNARE [Rhizoclosmatium globosum]
MICKTSGKTSGKTLVGELKFDKNTPRNSNSQMATDRTFQLRGVPTSDYKYTPIEDASVAVTIPGQHQSLLNPAENLWEFEEQRKAIHSLIERLENGVGKLNVLYDSLKSEINPSKSEQIKDRMNATSEEIDNNIQFARDGLKMMQRSKRGDKQYRSDIYKTYLQKLQTVTRSYMAVEQEIRGTVRSEFSRQYKIVKPNASEADIQNAIDLGQSEVFASAMVSSQQAVLSSVQARQKELVKLAQTLSDLFDLMTELQSLLNSQQEMIDLIEEHVSTTEVNLERGNKELTVANDFATRARDTKWKIFAILAIVVAIIIAVIIWQVTKKK